MYCTWMTYSLERMDPPYFVCKLVEISVHLVLTECGIGSITKIFGPLDSMVFRTSLYVSNLRTNVRT